MQFFFKEKQDPSKHKNYVSDIHIFVKQSMGVMFRFILPCAADSYNYHLARSTHICGLLLRAVRENDTMGPPVRGC